MIILNKLLKLTPRKLNLALFIIAIMSMSSIIIYLFKSGENVSTERYIDCKEELMILKDKYYNLSETSRKEISNIYSNTIKDIKATNKVIAIQVSEIKKKENILKNKQKYLDDVLQKIKK